MFLTANTEKLTSKLVRKPKADGKDRNETRIAFKISGRSGHVSQEKSFQRIFDCIPFYVRVTSSVFHIVQHYFVATTPPLNQNGFLHFHKVGRGKK